MPTRTRGTRWAVSSSTSRARSSPTTGCRTSTRRKSARRTATPTCTSTTSTCSPAIAPAGRCGLLLHEGLNGVPGKVEAGPPKHMGSAVGQIVNFLGTLQNEWAGAQAFSSFDTYMAPFIRKDAMTFAAVKQCIQELIYNLNVPSRLGHADAVHEPDVRLGVSRRPRGPDPGHRRAGNAVHLRRPAVRDGHDQPRVHGSDDRGRRARPGVHVPDPHLQHHAGLRLGPSELRSAVRDDRALRPAVFPELPEFGTEAQHDPVDVLPAAAGPHGTC